MVQQPEKDQRGVIQVFATDRLSFKIVCPKEYGTGGAMESQSGAEVSKSDRTSVWLIIIVANVVRLLSIVFTDRQINMQAETDTNGHVPLHSHFNINE